MKFSGIQLSLLALIRICQAEVDSGEGSEEALQQANFDISYECLERDVGGLSSFMEFESGDNATLKYTFSNKEDLNVSVVGLGGRIYDVQKNEDAANISASAIGPLGVDINGTTEFQHVINLILREGDYVLSPDVYVQKENETMRVVTNPSLIRILPPPMSFFNPKFMLVQMVLGALIAAFSYFTFFKPSASSGRDAKRQGSDGSASRIESSWLPDNHQRKK
ncbi:LAQU0S04e04346g1_1 [Lachancea quebecensis]|uniref:Increased recombination centers protein 22 n=1 Tax=Lachancea quebecensis TaxID=1654605 RepID=A0A0N7MLD0_9SACH|nr:LAQU0S04e04346g1_1 [Lachancea quebecensis]